MKNYNPININNLGSKKIMSFVVYGDPKVQKNDLMIMKKRNKSGKNIRIIGHSNKMKDIRNKFTLDMYKQYVDQGFNKPIDYYICIDIIFYIKKSSEPDLDNLVALPLDAMEGMKTRNVVIVAQMLTNDKLVRKIISEKIVKGDDNYHGEPRTEIRIYPY